MASKGKRLSATQLWALGLMAKGQHPLLEVQHTNFRIPDSYMIPVHPHVNIRHSTVTALLKLNLIEWTGRKFELTALGKKAGALA